MYFWLSPSLALVIAVGSHCLWAEDGQPPQNQSDDALADLPVISMWYGDRQSFGHVGHSQPLINVLGSIRPASAVADMSYRVNRGRRKQLILGPDLHRLAQPGDFNIEIDRDSLKPGENIVQIRCRSLRGVDLNKEVIIQYTPDTTWTLPYEVDFAKLSSIQDAVDVVDGKWKLTDQGVRTEVPYYDRQLAWGDATWKDFELEAEIIFHHHFVDFEGRNPNGPPYLSHAHTSFNLRWAGHPDDGWVPRRDWQSLGSLVALRCDLAQRSAGSYWWMHFGRAVPGRSAKRSVQTPDTRHDILLETPYRYRMRVETLGDRQARYRTKVWQAGEKEPSTWQMEAIDESEAFASGGVVFVVHHSDVTLCKVSVHSLEGSDSR